MTEFVRDLMAHAAWANAAFFRAWAEPLRENEELRRRVDHLVGVQQGFLSVLRGEKPGGPPPGPPDTFHNLLSRAKLCHAGLDAFAAGLTADDLERRVHVKWFGDPPFFVSVRDALVQVAMHSQHHRGQLMTRLRDLDGTPVNVDYIIWLWMGKPAAGWE